MRLNTVQITNFRSIDDSGEFTVEDVTCLVGKNESGKTAVLEDYLIKFRMKQTQ